MHLGVSGLPPNDLLSDRKRVFFFYYAGKPEKEYEMILKRTLKSICLLNVNPNTTISIIIQVRLFTFYFCGNTILSGACTLCRPECYTMSVPCVDGYVCRNIYSLSSSFLLLFFYFLIILTVSKTLCLILIE